MGADMALRNRDKVAVRRSPMKTLWHPIVFLRFRLNYLSLPTHPHACRDGSGGIPVPPLRGIYVLCLLCSNSCPNLS